MNDEARRQPWVELAQDLGTALPGLFTERLELLALELHRAGRSIVRIAALMLLAAILGVTAWLVLCGGIALALVALGLALPLAMLAVLLVNLLLAWVALARIRRLMATLGLPATRRHLVFGAGTEAGAGDQVPARPLTIVEGRS